MSSQLFVFFAAGFGILVSACTESAGRSDGRTATSVTGDRPSTPLTSDLRSFVPSGWHSLDTAYGDLDGTAPSDAVLVIERDSIVRFSKAWLGDSVTIDDRPRKLLVLLGSSDGGFRVDAEAPGAVLSASEGGLKGDPYGDVNVERGTVVLAMEGGSADLWNLTYRFRLQNGNWFLIGATHGGGNAERAYKYDWNLNTGRIEITEFSARAERDGAKRTERSAPRDPVSMTGFFPWTLNPVEEVWF